MATSGVRRGAHRRRRRAPRGHRRRVAFTAVPARARASRGSRHRAARRLARARGRDAGRCRRGAARSRSSRHGAPRGRFGSIACAKRAAARRPSSSSRRAPACARPRRTACGWRSRREAASPRCPVRSAFAGAIFGIAGIAAVLVFAASLGHLVATPRLSGWTWDLQLSVPTTPGAVCADANRLRDHARSRSRSGVGHLLPEHRGRRPPGDRMGIPLVPRFHRARGRGRPRAARPGRDRAGSRHPARAPQAHRRHREGARPERNRRVHDRRPHRAPDDRRRAAVGRRRVVHQRRPRSTPAGRTEPDALRARAHGARRRSLRRDPIDSAPSRRSGAIAGQDGVGGDQAPGADQLVPGDPGGAARDAGARRRRARARHFGAAPAPRDRAAQDHRLRPAAGGRDGCMAGDDAGRRGTRRGNPDRDPGRSSRVAPRGRRPRGRDRGNAAGALARPDRRGRARAREPDRVLPGARRGTRTPPAVALRSE